jgi:hypothetical protein
MSRNEEFKAAALYHGTSHPFEIGDIVLPTGGHHYGTTGKLAYATPLVRMAKANAEKRGGSGVYTVEPVDADEAKWSEDKAVVTSRLGFRVTGKHDES